MSRKRQMSLWTSSENVPEPTKVFNPRRLTLARKRMGLTKVEFSARAGLALRSLAAYELGEYEPPQDAIAKISSVSRFPPPFFYGNDLEEPHPENVSFRSMARMGSSLRDVALSQGALGFHFSQWVEERFELPPVDIPDLRHERSPEAAAETLRHHWGIGELPVRNVVHLLESKGVRIFSLSVSAREVDAFSTWKQDVPFIFLNTQKSSEHSRYDAAHELGHLVLHRHGGPHGRGAEQEANLFASAFLMPRASVVAHANTFPTLSDLLELKKIWNVSVAALNYRLHAVGMVTDWNYRSLCIQIAQNGYRTTEPNSAPRETSQVLPKIFEAVYEDGLARADVANALCIPQTELEQLLFGLAIATIEGGGKGPGPSRAPLFVIDRDRPN